METLPAAALVLALIGASTALGLVWRARQGRVRAAGGSEVIRPADVDASVAFGDRATLLQFSTEFCARCPGTRRLLGEAADARPGVTHVDVDLTHRADLATRFNILQTPTTLILDGTGRVRARVGGAPHRSEIARQLDELTVDARPPAPLSPLRSRNVPSR
ncbi:thioredoxin [Cryobacterium melibiosiphilum]|uniref:Thioredoxin n=1 Tax=Cryobacterium melibiosiphilum TaxID=995039 RepID=A0A3A5MP74_9MICO|nr:thioredoxin family protein [Cryobacterium melibiosiphilum]RJT87304.1 thioredoxin [Cryobacterium melibiosiphilum]